MIRPVNMPEITVGRLAEWYRIATFIGTIVVKEHYFAEGRGVKVRALSKDEAVSEWMNNFRNPWWKRLIGFPEYTIPVIDDQAKPAEYQYSSYEVYRG